MRSHFILIFQSICFLGILNAPAKIRSNAWQYIFPKPDAQFVSSQTTLIFRARENWPAEAASRLLSVSVRGMQSGLHTGRIVLSDDQKTFVFKPDRPFAPGETVQVAVNVNSPNRAEPLEYKFTTSKIQAYDHRVLYRPLDEVPLYKNAPKTETDRPISVINGVAVPSDFPEIHADVLGQTAEGKLFMANSLGVPYLLIFENDGTPYFYQRLSGASRDFKVQPTRTLTRWIQENLYCFVEMDSNYAIIDTLRCGNGYGTDAHEVLLLPDHHVLLIALDYQSIDMSELVEGGDPNATVIGNHVQELDENRNVVFEWRSWDHLNILDAVNEDFTANMIDYVHMNAIAVDYDNHILVSSRHLSEVTKIDRQTGEIIWRLGGQNNQFEFLDDEFGISYQHDVRPVSGKKDHYTIFDNGNFHAPKFSRAVEFWLDTGNKTATKVWEYRHQPDRYTPWMGNAQRLSNGNTLINWGDGSLPKATEVTPEGKVVYESNFDEYLDCYRTFRFDWKGTVKVPYLVVESHSDKVTLIFNKFGDKKIKNYVVYADTFENPTTPIDTTSGTWVDLWNLQNHKRYFFRVTAVDSSGTESGFSNQENALVKYIDPGGNLLLNGDFSDGEWHWILKSGNGASAMAGFDSTGQYHLFVQTTGSEMEDIQIRQEEIELIEGQKYRFEFDAYADGDCLIEAKIEKALFPWTNYGEIGLTFLRDRTEHFVYELTMNQKTDYRVRVVFNCGQSTVNIHLDNISLREMDPSVYIQSPKLLAPPDSGTVNQRLPIIFRWASQEPFNNFQIQVATDPWFESRIADVEHLLSTFYQLSSIVENDTLYWHVRAFNGARPSTWTKPYMFRTVAPEITVVSPNGEEQIQRGSSCFIRWQDNIEEEVAIFLYKADTWIAVLDSASSSGMFGWSVDLKLPTGADYRIMIRSVADTVLLDFSDNVFSVVDTTAQEITILSPNGEERVQRGQNFLIRWESDMDDSFAIFLYKADTLVAVLDSAASSGMFGWSVDPKLPAGSDYRIMIRSVADTALLDFSDNVFSVVDTTSSVHKETKTIDRFALHQNYPNPFNSETTIVIELPKSEFTMLKIYDTSGRELKLLINESKQAGTHSCTWNSRSLPSGIYFYKLQTQSFSQIRKMILLK